MSRLSRLLKPKSIALFGGAWAENVLTQLQKSDYSGAVWPVHPTRETMCSVPCFKSVDDLPHAPDASFIGVNRELTIGIVGELSKRGAGGATCFASGFLESEKEVSGGADLQQALIKAAGEMPIIGPNCYGILNYLDNITLWPDQHGGRPCKSGVAIIGQSSNILINMTMQKRSLPIAYVLAAGNQAQTCVSELVEAVLNDNRVTTIGLYLEGFGDIRDFEAMAAKALELGKPIVAIKAGKSEKSRASTLSHTASLAGGAEASSALLKRLGITEVDGIAVFLETLKVLHVNGPMRDNSVASLSCSGGEASLISDMAATSKLNFRDFSNSTTSKLKETLGPLVTVANPLDYHTFIWSDYEKLVETYAAVFADDFALNILIMDVPPTDRCDMSAWKIPLQALIDAKHKTKANVALLSTLQENLSEELSDRLIDNGITPLHGMEEMIQAVDAAIRAGQIKGSAREPVLLAAGDECEAETLDEAQSKSTLAGYGITFPNSVTGNTSDEIAKAVQRLEFPVALKGLGLAHKSEAGAVKLNLNSSAEVEEAATSMENVTGYLAEEMVTGAVAELIVGINRDPTGTFVLTIGAGGILTELLSDSASLLVPSTRDEILDAIRSLRVYTLLNGYRGKPVADLEAIVDTILAVQAYCVANPHLLELDLNPVLARPKGATAVDALIRLEK